MGESTLKGIFLIIVGFGLMSMAKPSLILVFVGMFLLYLGFKSILDGNSQPSKPKNSCNNTVHKDTYLTKSNRNHQPVEYQPEPLSHAEAIKKAGDNGEENVIFHLDYLDREKYRVINDLSILNKENNIKNQIDHIVIGPNGIFNLETKCWSGTLIIDKAKNWTRIKHGETKQEENPEAQIQRHREAIENVLGSKELPIVDVLVISYNDKRKNRNLRQKKTNITIQGEKNSKVYIIKAEQISYFIEDYQSLKKLSNKEINNIARTLERNKTRENKFSKLSLPK